ncbi:MAG: response regulator [Chitinophagaceae bacterium]|jgi:DNA-binding response OmpR family regulator|nr:response regulator [Chitinophagaceae bacterium]
MATISHTVLVVDDDPYILMSLEFLMRKNGFEVLVARNGTEAMDMLAARKPHLVVLDVMMPDVDGYEICRHIRNTGELAHTHVVFLSAKSSEADVQKGLLMGAARYITKPFSTRHLVKEVKQLLEEASAA